MQALKMCVISDKLCSVLKSLQCTLIGALYFDWRVFCFVNVLLFHSMHFLVFFMTLLAAGYKSTAEKGVYCMDSNGWSRFVVDCFWAIFQIIT